jgi:hypothetical protein
MILHVCKQQIIIVILQFYLSAIPADHLSPAVKSAAAPYIRPLSQGQQIFTPDTKQFPVGQPITKLTAKLQVRVKINYRRSGRFTLACILFGKNLNITCTCTLYMYIGSAMSMYVRTHNNSGFGNNAGIW